MGTFENRGYSHSVRTRVCLCLVRFSKYIAAQNYSSIGVFATQATINTHAYQKSVSLYNNKIKVFESACPNWAYIVEHGLQNEPKNKENIKNHLEEMIKNKPEKIILGCTHYPYLINVLSEYVDANIFIDPAEYFAQFIADDIKTAELENNQKDYEPKFYVSSNPKQFTSSSELFYRVENPQLINISSSLLHS